MDNTTKSILFFDGGGFYLVTDRAKTPVDAASAVSMKSGYDLVLDDSLLFYTSMEFPHTQKRRPDVFIKNWLSTGFPAEFTKFFGYVKKGDVLLIGLFKPDFFENPTVKKIIEKAGRIASPMTIRYSSESNFTHSYGNVGLSVEEGILKHAPHGGSDTKKTYKISNGSALTLPSFSKTVAGFGGYKIPAAVFLVCYLLFVAGSYLRLSYHTKRLAAAEQMLQSVYERAGVADSPDPFGMLMFRAGKNSDGETFKNMKILETLSRIQSDRITAVSVEIKNGMTLYEGISEDFIFIEDFKKQLKKETGKEINITDIKKGENGITFKVRF